MVEASDFEFDWFFVSQARSDISTIEQLFETGVFRQGIPMSVSQAIVTSILIHLNDLLQKAKGKGFRVSFTDDMMVTDKILDVTDLVREFRNAAAHIPSALRRHGTNTFSFNIVKGRGSNFSSDLPDIGYDDDFAIIYGGMHLYLHRHIVRAFQEIAPEFSRIYEEERNRRIDALQACGIA